MIAGDNPSDDLELAAMDATLNEAVLGGWSNGNSFISTSGIHNSDTFYYCYDFGTNDLRWAKYGPLDGNNYIEEFWDIQIFPDTGWVYFNICENYCAFKGTVLLFRVSLADGSSSTNFYAYDFMEGDTYEHFTMLQMANEDIIMCASSSWRDDDFGHAVECGRLSYGDTTTTVFWEPQGAINGNKKVHVRTLTYASSSKDQYWIAMYRGQRNSENFIGFTIFDEDDQLEQFRTTVNLRNNDDWETQTPAYSDYDVSLRRLVYVCEQESSASYRTGSPAGLYGVVIFNNDITVTQTINSQSMTFIDGTRFSRVMSVFRGGNDYSIAFADDLVNEVYIAMFTVTGSSASVITQQWKMGDSSVNPFSLGSSYLNSLKLTSLTGGYMYGLSKTLRTYSTDCVDHFWSLYSSNRYWAYLMPTDDSQNCCVNYKPTTTTTFTSASVGSITFQQENEEQFKDQNESGYRTTQSNPGSLNLVSDFIDKSSWCIEQKVVYTINPTITEETDWTIFDTYSDTFSEYTTTPTCDDAYDIDHILYSQQESGSNVNYFSLNDGTRTIDTGSTWAQSAWDRNVFDLTIYSFYPDGRCIADQQAVTVYEVCDTSQLSAFQTQATSYVYYLYEDFDVQFDETTVVPKTVGQDVSSCNFEYTIHQVGTDLEMTTGNSLPWIQIDDSNANAPTFTDGTDPTDIDNWSFIGTYDVYIKAVKDASTINNDYPNQEVVTPAFQISWLDPCDTIVPQLNGKLFRIHVDGTSYPTSDSDTLDRYSTNAQAAPQSQSINSVCNYDRIYSIVDSSYLPISLSYLYVTDNGSDQPTITLSTINPLYQTDEQNIGFYLQVFMTKPNVNLIDYDYFEIRIDDCRVTNFVSTPQIDLYYDIYTTPKQFTFAHFTETPDCDYSITYTLQMYDGSSWSTVSSYPTEVIQTYAINDNRPSANQDHTITLYTEDISHEKMWTFRIEGSISISDQNPNVISDFQINYDINVKNGCELDTISYNAGTNTVADFTYIIGSGNSLTFNPTWTQSLHSCPVDTTLMRTDSVAILNTDIDFTSGDGEPPTEYIFYDSSVFYLSQETTYDGEVWPMEMTRTSRHSLQGASGYSTIPYSLTFRDRCWDAVLSTLASVDVVRDVWQPFTTQWTFTPMVDTPTYYSAPFDVRCKDQYADHSYELVYVSGPLSTVSKQDELLAHYTIDNGLNLITGTVTDKEWVGVHTLRMRGRNAGRFDYYDSPTFTLEIVDPCLITDLNPAGANQITLSDMQTTVLNPNTPFQKYYEFQDSASQTYGDGYNRCGPRSYSLVEQSSNGSKSFATLWETIKQISFQTESRSDVGTYTFVLKAYLYEYPDRTADITFKVVIDECVLRSFTISDISDRYYLVGQTSLDLSYEFFQLPCNYVATYDVFDVTEDEDTEEELPDFISSGSQSPWIRVFTGDENDIGVYTLRVRVSLDDPDASNLSFDFELDVKSIPTPDYLDTVNQAPYLDKIPVNQQVYFLEPLTYYLGEPKDFNNDNIEITVDIMGDGFYFIKYTDTTFDVPAGAGVPSLVGNYRIKITLTDDNENGPLSTTYEFWINLLEDPENPVSEWEQALPVNNSTWNPAWDEYQFIDLRDDYEQIGDPPIPFIVSLSYTGRLLIGFDKPMQVPNQTNVEQIPETDVLILPGAGQTLGRRRLQELWKQQLTPEEIERLEFKDALELSVIPGYYSDPIKLNFTWDLIEYKKQSLELQLHFELPPFISSEVELDTLQVVFWGSDYFQGENNIRVKEGTTLTKPITRQIDADELNSIEGWAGFFVGLLKFLLCVDLILAILLRRRILLPFWTTIGTLQLISHTPLFATRMPANLAVFLKEMLSLSKLDIFGLDKTVRENWGYEPSGGLNPVFEQHGYMGFCYVPNLGMVFVLWMLCLSFWIIAALKDKFYPKILDKWPRNKVLNHWTFKEKWEPFMCNFNVRFFMMAYLEISLCVFINLQNLSSYSPGYTMSAFLAIISLLLIFGFYFFVFSLFIGQHGPDAETRTVNERFKTIYYGMDLMKPNNETLYTFIFLLRRLIYGLVVTTISDHPYRQIWLMIMTSCVMLFTIFHYRPFWDKWQNRFELFNEFAVLFVMCHLLLFTFYVPGVFERIDYGIYMMTIISLVFIFDCIVLIYYSLKYSCGYLQQYWKGQVVEKIPEPEAQDDEEAEDQTKIDEKDAAIDQEDEAQKKNWEEKAEVDEAEQRRLFEIAKKRRATAVDLQMFLSDPPPKKIPLPEPEQDKKLDSEISSRNTYSEDSESQDDKDLDKTALNDASFVEMLEPKVNSKNDLDSLQDDQSFGLKSGNSFHSQNLVPNKKVFVIQNTLRNIQTPDESELSQQDMNQRKTVNSNDQNNVFEAQNTFKARGLTPVLAKNVLKDKGKFNGTRSPVSARSHSSFQKAASEIMSNTPRRNNLHDAKDYEMLSNANRNGTINNPDKDQFVENANLSVPERQKDPDEDSVVLSRMKTIMKELKMAK